VLHGIRPERLQKALLQARQGPQFREHLGKNELKNRTIGKRAEDCEAAFAADMAEPRKLNRWPGSRVRRPKGWRGCPDDPRDAPLYGAKKLAKMKRADDNYRA
jgi:hypothetical protein